MAVALGGTRNHRGASHVSPVFRARVFVLVVVIELAGALLIGWLRHPIAEVPTGSVTIPSHPSAMGAAVHLPDDVLVPPQVKAVGPITPYRFEGKVVGWTVTGRVERVQVDQSMRDLTSNLRSVGYQVEPPGPSDAFAVRHVGSDWNLVKAAAVCPLQGPECDVTILFATRAG